MNKKKFMIKHAYDYYSDFNAKEPYIYFYITKKLKFISLYFSVYYSVSLVRCT